MVYLTHNGDNSSHYQNLMIIARSHNNILTGVMVSFDTHKHAHMHTCTHPYKYCMLSNICFPLPGCRVTHYLHTHACTYAYTDIHPPTHAFCKYMQTHIQCVLSVTFPSTLCIYTCKHMHVCMYVCIYTYTHSHT